MNLCFDESLIGNYKNNSQIIRILSENWVENNIYCPCCGNHKIRKLKNNERVKDFQCDSCGEVYELKSKKGNIGKKINDGAYSTMIERISNNINTDLLIMQYDNNAVTNFLVVPKFFFTTEIIEKRKPLSANAIRAGWVGCNILYENIPEQGKIQMIYSKNIIDADIVKVEYAKAKRLQIDNLENRSWLFDILECVNKIAKPYFSLKDIYNYSNAFKLNHPYNNNIEAKIRQQLQILRDKSFIIFLGNGNYKLLN